jgi:hypothetical protein
MSLLKRARLAHIAGCLLSSLLSCGLLLSARAAQAQVQAQAAPVSCARVERELTSARVELERARQGLRAAQGQATELEALREKLALRERERDERSAALDACKKAKDDLCTAAGSFVQRLGAGQLKLGGLGACVDPDARRDLGEQLSGWSNASATLARLGAFSAGESDALPGLGASSGSRVEKLVARLFASGNGSPLIYRRLLVEALKLTVPAAWRELEAQPGGVEHWFSSDDALDPAIAAEMLRATAGKPVDTQVPALATATSLIQSYELLAGCNGARPARDCRRATQLLQLLESSGPLIARRRVQDVWASECSALSEDVVEKWLQDLPPARASEARVETVTRAVRSKLFTCFLRDAAAPESFPGWLSARLPSPKALTGRTFSRVLELEGWWQTGSPVDACAHAVRALQTMAAPNECAAPAELLESVQEWSRQRSEAHGSFGFELCDRLGLALWGGESASLPDAFSAPPTVDDTVRLLADAPPTNVARLRGLCAARAGSGAEFERSLRNLGQLARALGESTAQPPWNLTAELEPVELQRSRRGAGLGPWLRSLGVSASREACTLLELPGERCAACRDLPDGSHYDCGLLQQLKDAWAVKTRTLLLGALLVLAIGVALRWALRLRRALLAQGPWREQALASLHSVGLEPRPDRLRYLFPARLGQIELELPATPGWERFGRRAALVRCENGGFQDRDVHRAGSIARSYGAETALLLHDEGASPDLGAVRSILEWAARGAGKAVHILPLSLSRLKWSRDANDLLELAEESSLRGNPFEVRGRITSSTQFFNRERLVSGLLASAQAGRFTVVTSLRRFGKSSLALEVARRLPGPSAYVDLTGFHHEIHFSRDPAEAADAILRFLCMELLESARSRQPGRPLELAVPSGKLDATALAAWFRDFGQALAEHGNGQAPPALLILDELEHAIGAARELNHALEVFAILVGRLRNTLPGLAAARGQRVGVLFCSALHPLLWSPLGTLAHQSLVGSFELVAVPCLPEEAAAAMMRGLGSRQGVRFTDAALWLLLRESQSVPLLLRRLGSAVLELYDPERARHGGLGAVEIGIEGARAAIEREVSRGSPLSVWIESEIAHPESPGGAILRRLAQCEHGAAQELRALAAKAFLRQFELTGLTLELTPVEAQRRAEEAAAVVLRTLGDSGLLRAHGDPTEPEAFELPDGVIRRVLRGEAG